MQQIAENEQLQLTTHSDEKEVQAEQEPQLDSGDPNQQSKKKPLINSWFVKQA
jgi:hypothetical protein